ncbi:hypothetical protein EDB80DRAFT_449349 [Ilyonectria destructans]|nr:hypothetical protein EDB80DRAFT_449349 [Ilyonectria destructans]
MVSADPSSLSYRFYNASLMRRLRAKFPWRKQHRTGDNSPEIHQQHKTFRHFVRSSFLKASVRIICAVCVKVAMAKESIHKVVSIAEMRWSMAHSSYRQRHSHNMWLALSVLVIIVLSCRRPTAINSDQ